MNISISFPDEIENALRSGAAAVGVDIETFVKKIVTEQLADDRSNPKPGISPEEFAKRSAAWIRLHPVLDHAIDDSRESIYAGCGE